jgi:hypothetical protein
VSISGVNKNTLRKRKEGKRSGTKQDEPLELPEEE